MELVFATQNPNKALEIEAKLGDGFTILSLDVLGITEEIPETAATLEGNALMKARYVYKKTGRNCFADDTGLEVEALNGEPGVYSARYAGAQKSPEDNMNLLLQNLQGKSNRNARFRTVIALIFDGGEYLFEGIAPGTIIDEKRGTEGFGYDPLFVPAGHSRTFAQMPLGEKNQLSHRAQAFDKMKAFLSLRQSIKLRTATPDDLAVLQHWDEQPHVIQSDPNDDWNWETELTKTVAWRELLIAELDGGPVGFVQIIDPAEEESHYWGNVEPNLRAIDIWIGEETDLGKGYGTVMMQLALERCFTRPQVAAVLIDPLETNSRAIRFYERIGFKFLERRKFGEDNCMVYRLSRYDWLNKVN